MIDPELAARLDKIEASAQAAARAAEAARKYLFWTGVITIVVIVLPMIALAFVLPSFISSYTTTLNGFGY